MKWGIGGLAVLLLVAAVPAGKVAAGPDSAAGQPDKATAESILKDDGLPKGPEAGSPSAEELPMAPGPVGGDPASLVGLPGSRPARADSLEDLQRSFAAEAYGGLDAGSAKPRPQTGKSAAGSEADPLLDLRKVVGDYLQVDAVNGLGQTVGLKNQLVEEVKSVEALRAELGAWKSDGASELDSTQASISGVSTIAGNSAQSGESHVRPPPGWISSILDSVNSALDFLLANWVIVLSLALAMLVAVSMARRLAR